MLPLLSFASYLFLLFIRFIVNKSECLSAKYFLMNYSSFEILAAARAEGGGGEGRGEGRGGGGGGGGGGKGGGGRGGMPEFVLYLSVVEKLVDGQ